MLARHRKEERASSLPGRPSFDELYDHECSTVGRWAVRLGGPNLDADDVTQEVFLVAYRLLPSFRGEAQIRTWLFRITRNVVRSHLRRERWSRRLGGADELSPDIVDERTDRDEANERLHLRQTLYRILDQMKENYRTVLVLFELEEKSGEEISELLGVKLATVWVWLHRARLDFQRRLHGLEARR